MLVVKVERVVKTADARVCNVNGSFFGEAKVVVNLVLRCSTGVV